MEFEGLWQLVATKTINMQTFEMEWMSNDELNALPDDHPGKMLANILFEAEDGVLRMFCPVNVEGAPQEEIDEAIAAGAIKRFEGQLMLCKEFEYKEEDGKVFINSKEEGEVLGEKIDPWKPVIEEGNTIIILENYQAVPMGEIPSVVQKTVKEVKTGSAEETAAAGTYIGRYTRFVGDPDTAKDDKKPFKLVLNADRTGTSFRNDLEIKVPDWSLEGGSFKMTEKFVGTIDYTGTLSGNDLVLYNGDPANAMTCMYVYIKE